MKRPPCGVRRNLRILCAMKTSYRYDRGSIEPIETGEGFLRARVKIARDGVFPYIYPDGKVYREAKLADELFSELTINSAKGAPITDGHPPVSDSKGLVTPQNASKYVKGSLGDSIVVEDGHICATETVFDAALIAKLERGESVEVSVGFRTDIDDTPGEYKGERYDAAQRNIVINHLAHVPQGRAGESCRTYLDGADDVAVMSDDTSVRSDEMKQKTRIDEKGAFEAFKAFVGTLFHTDEDDIPPAVDPAKKEKETEDEPASDDVTLLNAQIEALKLLLTEKTKQLDEITKKAAEATAPETLDALICARTKLIDAARAIIPDVKTDGMKDKEIKLAVIGKTLPFDASVKNDACDDAVIDARFDAALAIEREKAAVRGDRGNGSSQRLDEAAIEKKRQSRLNIQDIK